MSSSIKCPNCFQEVPKGNRFCVFCGNDLSGVEATEVVGREIRVCANGHKIDDPELKFCTVCGLPLEPTAATSKSDPAVDRPKRKWKCSCGAENDMDTLSCRSCGKPKGWSPDPEPAKSPDIKIPEGMRSPGPEDLLRKS